MKILFLIDGLLKGGKERQLFELIKGLKNKGEFSMELVVMNEKIEYKEIFDLDIKINFLVRRTKKDFSIFLKLIKIYKRFKPDILHTFDTMTTFYSLPIKFFYNIKLINGSIRFAALNIEKNFKLYYLYKFLFIFSDYIVANSLAGLKTFNLKQSNKNIFIYNGFDFKRLLNLDKVESIRNKFQLESKKIVCMVSSFAIHKDNESYIRAALLVLSKRDDVLFLAAGDGVDLDRCKKIANNNSKIMFLGNQNNIESIINVSDIGVLTSKIGQWGEGISNSILEFHALKKPVIATDSGGTNEIVYNNKNGFLLENNNPKYLSEKINYLLDNPKILEEFGQNANDNVKQKFNLEKMINKYSKLYRNEL